MDLFAYLRTNWNYPNRCGDLDQMLTYIIHKLRRQVTLAVRGPQSIFFYNGTVFIAWYHEALLVIWNQQVHSFHQLTTISVSHRMYSRHPQIAARAPFVARGGVLSGARANSKKIKIKIKKIKNKKKNQENHPILVWFCSIGNVFKVPLQSLELQRWVKKPFWNVQHFNCCKPLSLIFLTIVKCNIWMLKWWKTVSKHAQRPILFHLKTAKTQELPGAPPPGPPPGASPWTPPGP